MPKDHACTHDENRSKICIFCCKKKGCSGSNKITKIINGGKLESLVNVIFVYKADDQWLPNGICSTCLNKLYKSKETQQKLLEPPNLSFFQYKNINTRSSNQLLCECSICQLARKTPDNLSIRKTPTLKGIASTMVQNSSQGKCAAEGSCGKLTANKRCDDCFSLISKGKSHKCNSLTRLNNLKTFISESTPQVQDHVVASTLKEKLGDANQATNASDSSLSLKQLHGKPLNIVLKPSNKGNLNTPTIKANDMKKIQSKFSLSQNVTVGIASMIRVATQNRHIIEPNLRENLSANIHCLDEFFDIKQYTFKIKKGDKVSDFEQTAVYCKNLKGLIDYVKEERNASNVHLKFGIDSGGGSLKICLSIQSIESESEGHNEGRKKYNEGVTSKSFQDSGVKKLFILGLAEKVQENYENVKKLWSDIGINSMNGTIAADIKLANIMTGIMSSSSSYPCTWCNVSKEKLDQNSTLRTIRNIEENYLKWNNAGKKKELAKNYMCCISPPIFVNDPDKTILDIIPPPELHLVLGVVNGLFNHLSKESEQTALSWAKMCNVEREVTYGGASFNGNSCKKLLDKLDNLRSICPLECLKFLHVFSDFRQVVKACFSKALDPEYTKYINNFKNSYLNLGVSVTPKVHCIFVHIKEFCEGRKVGLGIFSEQAFEAVHFEFKTIWIKHKIHTTHLKYAKHLLSAVCEFNGLHV